MQYDKQLGVAAQPVAVHLATDLDAGERGTGGVGTEAMQWWPGFPPSAPCFVTLAAGA
jgi:hypothetical protein